jgi:hypothetical protein
MTRSVTRVFPQDEHGLPESIRFWKQRVEAPDELTFTVGVLYGPSGCGKSSLVKARLLLRLARHVLSVYVEATADDTWDNSLRATPRTYLLSPDEVTNDRATATRPGHHSAHGGALPELLAGGLFAGREPAKPDSGCCGKGKSGES